jgi:hypothetical protein
MSMLCLMAIVLSRTSRAQDGKFEDKCAQWIEKKGFTRNYIATRIDKLQPGSPTTWRGNVEAGQVQVGDIVLVRLRDAPESLKAGYVETVARGPDGIATRAEVSSWNWGGGYVDRGCSVTKQFGQHSLNPVLGTEIVRVWRPSLPLPAATPK